MQTLLLWTNLQLELTAKVLVLEEEVEELKRAKDEIKMTKKDGKTYSTDMRMLIFDAIVSQVPTQNIPSPSRKHAQ